MNTSGRRDLAENPPAPHLDVSVVMPTWNRPQFLCAAIDSAFRQTVPIRELIISDDGSDSATRDVLEAYAAKPRIRVLLRDHCGRPGAVRNAAIREASGRYIAFADSDDVWHPEKLARQSAALQERPECRWSYTSGSLIDSQDRPVLPPGDTNPRVRVGSLLEALASFDVGVALPSVLAERTLLFQAGLFDESMGCYEDCDLWMRLALISDAAAVPESLVKVRLHENNYSRGNPYAALSGREKFLARGIELIPAPAVRAKLLRLRALNSAQIANLAASAGNASEAASRVRSSLAHGWSMPLWWFNAVRTHSQLLTLRARKILAGRG